MNFTVVDDLLTSMSGESPISPKLLSTDLSPGLSTIPVISEVVVDGLLPVPPVLPAVVLPLSVSAGWFGSVTT
ncbi:hypothetical protein D3C81_1401910 [compost metagenome]